MSKLYHISADGIARLCSAKKGQCPFGEHFKSLEEAQNAADQKSSKEYGIIPSIEKKKLPKGGAEYLIEKYSRVNSEGKTGLEVGEEKVEELENKIQSEAIKINKQRLMDLKELVNKQDSKVKEFNKTLEEKVALQDKGTGVGETCPKCGKGTMEKKNGSFGTFLGCSNFPECRNTKSYKENKDPKIKDLQKKQNELNEEIKDLEMQKHNKMDNVETPEYYKDLMREKNRMKDELGVAKYLLNDDVKIKDLHEFERELLREARVIDKIGPHTEVFKDSESDFGSNKITGKITVDSEGKINNLYHENSETGEITKIVELTDNDEGSNIVLENGERPFISYASTYSQRDFMNKKQYNRVYLVDSDTEEYTGPKEVSVYYQDSGD